MDRSRSPSVFGGESGGSEPEPEVLQEPPQEEPASSKGGGGPSVPPVERLPAKYAQDIAITRQIDWAQSVADARSKMQGVQYNV